MEDEPEVGFVLYVKPVLEGNKVSFPVESRRFGINEEVIKISRTCQELTNS